MTYNVRRDAVRIIEKKLNMELFAVLFGYIPSKT